MKYGRKQAVLRTAGGEHVPLTDRRVRLLVPAMGRFGSPLLPDAFASVGIRAEALPAADAEITAYFMPSAPGPCRFGQYNVLTRRLIARHNIADIAVFSPT